MVTDNLDEFISELSKVETDFGFDLEVQGKGDNSNFAHPSLTNVTHIIIGLDPLKWENNIVYVPKTDDDRVKAFKAVIELSKKHTAVAHNLSFDLRHVMYHTNSSLVKYDDTLLMAKTLLNKAKDRLADESLSLKSLTGSYYPDGWLFEQDYNNPDLFDKTFIEYCLIDGSAPLKLRELILTKNGGLSDN